MVPVVTPAKAGAHNNPSELLRESRLPSPMTNPAPAYGSGLRRDEGKSPSGARWN